MKKSILLTTTFFSIAALSGCASKLEVEHSRNGNGIAVPMPVSYVITKESQPLDKNGVKCLSKPITKKRDFINLPFGEIYTVNIHRGLFASNDFKIEFTDKGSLKSVMLNSDPQIDETIQATASLVKEIGTTASQLAPLAVGALIAPDEASCGKKQEETIICTQTFKDWRLSPNICP
jgi:hypothetical protein